MFYVKIKRIIVEGAMMKHWQRFAICLSSFVIVTCILGATTSKHPDAGWLMKVQVLRNQDPSCDQSRFQPNGSIEAAMSQDQPRDDIGMVSMAAFQRNASTDSATQDQPRVDIAAFQRNGSTETATQDQPPKGDVAVIWPRPSRNDILNLSAVMEVCGSDNSLLPCLERLQSRDSILAAGCLNKEAASSDDLTKQGGRQREER